MHVKLNKVQNKLLASHMSLQKLFPKKGIIFNADLFCSVVWKLDLVVKRSLQF